MNGQYFYRGETETTRKVRQSERQTDGQTHRASKRNIENCFKQKILYNKNISVTLPIRVFDTELEKWYRLEIKSLRSSILLCSRNLGLTIYGAFGLTVRPQARGSGRIWPGSRPSRKSRIRPSRKKNWFESKGKQLDLESTAKNDPDPDQDFPTLDLKRFFRYKSLYILFLYHDMGNKYKRKPDYVTSSLDTSNYKFSNLRKGNYLLVTIIFFFTLMYIGRVA